MDLSEKILNSARRNSKKLNHPCNKENIEYERSSSGMKFDNASLGVRLDEVEDEEAATGRTLSKIAMKKKEGFDRLLMQL